MQAVQDRASMRTALKEYDWTKYDPAIDVGMSPFLFVMLATFWAAPLHALLQVKLCRD